MSILTRTSGTRYKTSVEELEKLLVFGYQCKIFKDDEKASEIDRGTHLIPWMGNNSLLIDRYDGRGHLHNLEIHDAKNCHHEQLTDKERAIETACDEQRYLELNPDFELTLEREEEEMKRYRNELRGENSFAAVGFSYDLPDDGFIAGKEDDERDDDDDDEDDEDDEEFEAPLYFDLPPDMITPAGVKQHAIILHTAKFISNHGSQMEIMMATKQKHNLKFQFLNSEHELNNYYKHILHIVKIGKYHDDVPVSKQRHLSEPEDSSDDDDDGYLHPSLLKATTTPTMKQEQQQRRPAEAPHIVNSLSANQIVDTPYALLVSSLCASGYVPAAPPSPVVASELSTSTAETEITMSPMSTECIDERNKDEVIDSYTAIINNVSGLSSTNGLPDSNGDNNQHNRQMSSELENAIIKMADFVAKNGLEFEAIVRARDINNRFVFLDVSHPLNMFYTSMRISAQKKLLADDPNQYIEPLIRPKAISFSIGKSGKEERPEPIGNPNAMLDIMPVIDSIRNRLLREKEEKLANPPPPPAPQEIATPSTTTPSSSLISEMKRDRKLKAAIFVGKLPGRRKFEGPRQSRDSDNEKMNRRREKEGDEVVRRRDRRRTKDEESVSKKSLDKDKDGYKDRDVERYSDRDRKRERDRDRDRYKDKDRDRERHKDREETRRSHHKSSRHSKRHRHRTRSRSRDRNSKTKRYDDDSKRKRKHRDHISDTILKSSNKDDVIILSDDESDEEDSPPPPLSPLTKLNPELSDKEALQEKIKQLLKVTRSNT